MAKTSGGIRGSAKSSRRTGPGFTEPIKGPTKRVLMQQRFNMYLLTR